MRSHERVAQQRKHSFLDSLESVVMWPSVKTSPLVKPWGAVLGPLNALGFVAFGASHGDSGTDIVLYGACPGA